MANRFRNIPRQERLFRNESIFVPKTFIDTEVPKKFIDTNVPERYVPKPLTELSKMYEDAQKRGEKQLEAEDHANTVLGAIKGLQQVETYDQHLGVNDHNEVKSTIEEYKKRLNDITNSYVAADPERNRKLKEFSNEVSNNISSGRLSHILENAKTYQEMKDAIAKAKQNDPDYARNRYAYDSIEKELSDFAANGGTYGKDGTLRKLNPKPIGSAVDELKELETIGRGFEESTIPELTARGFRVTPIGNGKLSITNAEGLEVTEEQIRNAYQGILPNSNYGRVIYQQANALENMARTKAQAEGKEWDGSILFEGKKMTKDEYIKSKEEHGAQYLINKFAHEKIKTHNQIIQDGTTEAKKKAAAKGKTDKVAVGAAVADTRMSSLPEWTKLPDGTDAYVKRKDANGNEVIGMTSDTFRKRLNAAGVTYGTLPAADNRVGTNLLESRKIAMDRTWAKHGKAFSTELNKGRVYVDKIQPEFMKNVINHLLAKGVLSSDKPGIDWIQNWTHDDNNIKEISQYMRYRDPNGLGKYKTKEDIEKHINKPIKAVLNYVRDRKEEIITEYEDNINYLNPRDTDSNIYTVSDVGTTDIKRQLYAALNLVTTSNNIIPSGKESPEEEQKAFEFARNNWTAKGIQHIGYNSDGKLIYVVKYEDDKKDNPYEGKEGKRHFQDFSIAINDEGQAASQGLELAAKMQAAGSPVGTELGAQAILATIDSKRPPNNKLYKIIATLPRSDSKDHVMATPTDLSFYIEDYPKNVPDYNTVKDWGNKPLYVSRQINKLGKNTYKVRTTREPNGKALEFDSLSLLQKFLALYTKEGHNINNELEDKVEVAEEELGNINDNKSTEDNG